MLSSEERVRSFAHRNLKRLKFYDDISEYNGYIPPNLQTSKIVGIYTNSELDKVFVLLHGLYLEMNEMYVAYNDIISLETNRESVGKNLTNTIFISLHDDKQASLRILGRKMVEIGDVSREMGELWEFYTFLRHVINKRS